MKNLIKLKADYYLLSDEKIEECDWHFNEDFTDLQRSTNPVSVGLANEYGRIKVIATSEVHHLLDGLPLLKWSQIDILIAEKLAQEHFPDSTGLHSDMRKVWMERYFSSNRIMDDSKQLTEEDVISLMSWAAKSAWTYSKDESKTIEDLIPQFKIKIKSYTNGIKQWEVEIEMEQDGPSVISGGLRTGAENQPPGLQTHTSYKPKIVDGYIKILSIK